MSRHTPRLAHLLFGKVPQVMRSRIAVLFASESPDTTAICPSQSSDIGQTCGSSHHHITTEDLHRPLGKSNSRVVPKPPINLLLPDFSSATDTRIRPVLPRRTPSSFAGYSGNAT